MTTTINTTCPYCGVGCGIEVNLLDNGKVKIQGDKSHPANFGRLCSKGTALAQTLDLSERLLHPQVSGQQTDWDSALAVVADKFQQIIDSDGPDAVAFYVSGQLLTEDYYVANKLMKGFIGSGNIDTNSRLCMSSSVVGHKRAFGSDTVPGCYQDWEQCELMILTGSNTAWCHPVLYQRLVKAKQQNPALKVVVIDPRRTATADIADLHLALNPGTDAFLFNGLFYWLSQNGFVDDEFIAQSTQGLAGALQSALAHSSSIAGVAQACGLSEASVSQLYHWFADTEKTITVYSQGINQSSSGSDKVNAIINCHLLTGRIGKPGMGPFSVTGQPNAMGGREVGALANQLAAHMDYADPADIDRVSRFWSAANMSQQPGLKAVDLFNAMETGKIKAIWIMATNPAVSMPDSNRVRAALEQCDFVVLSDNMANTDTAHYADVMLPALAWGEKDGSVTNSERCISRQRAFLPAPGEARADWWILAEFARRMGYSGFDYQTTHDIFSEHAALSAYENQGSRDFDLTGLVNLDPAEYAELKPLQWPVLNKQQGRQRMFSDGRFFTASKRANFIGLTPGLPTCSSDNDFPLALNTGRIRDHWHTMTRTGKSPRLNRHISEPFVQLNQQDAEAMGIAHGDLVEVTSRQGSFVGKADITSDLLPGKVFAPMHWNDQYASHANIGRVVNAHTDPFSGQPEFKHTPVRITPRLTRWHGFILAREKIEHPALGYWTCCRREGLWQYTIADAHSADDWSLFSRQLLDSAASNGDWSELLDSSGQTYRAARFIDDRLDACIFIHADKQLPATDWLIQLFAYQQVDRRDRLRVLAGTPMSSDQDQGEIICSCYNVGRNKICKSIRDDQLTTVDQIGEKLQAGTNCGSCLPELNTLIKTSDC
ncbi:MAG: molybdopterin-dependent oxidoreductase [Gammaproteobacteria bacterium]|nr:molybdopterin-dependent oxidoreductase [Gammaproteobacteria bacterium]